MDFVNLTVLGRSVKDSERIAGEKRVGCKFTLVVNRKQMGRPEADFLPVVCWRDMSSMVLRGTRVLASGELVCDKWSGRDGKPRQNWKLLARDLVLVDPKPKAGGVDDDGGYGEVSAYDDMAEGVPF